MTTLSIHTSGKFVLASPFNANASVRYTVTALREFSDLYLKGVDVYTQFYKPYGLVDGVEYNGTVFSFATEASLNPTIVTLEGDDDTVLYIPSTYIETYPIEGDVNYSRLILTADLGALPDAVSLESILQDVEDLIEATFGVRPIANIARGFTGTQPTMDEHLILEQSRIGSIASADNNFSENNKLKEENALLDAQVKSLTRILADNNLI